MSSVHDAKVDSSRRRLELIKRRHRKIILNSDDAFTDEFVEDDEILGAFDEEREMGRYEDNSVAEI